jgi:hypothetical protein
LDSYFALARGAAQGDVQAGEIVALQHVSLISGQTSALLLRMH